MDTFNIQLGNHETGVTRRDEDVFIVRLPEKTIYVEKRQDNEGANHWFEQGKDNETSLTANIGAAIENWLAKHNS
ncbi:hypothetical protein AB6805_16460 [Chitinophaga sp. RCC_12]|uniref:hypothetical protein n=1 Tax=unclassified Chitinophaga TaxID=2619133 RepID=UPI003525F8FB